MRFSYKLAGGLAIAAAAGTVAAGVGMVLVDASIYRRVRLANLRGKIVLITGGSRGLGLAMAEEFARQGCHLVLCARDAEELELARRHLDMFGAVIETVVCDISKQEEVQRLVVQAANRFGRIDVLVNNAGIISVGPIQSHTLEDYERAMNTMFWGVVYPTLEVLPQMIERRSGNIVNITSIGGRMSVPHLLPYCCAKFAAVGFSEGLRAELARESVKVTTVLPGLMRTGSYKNAEMKGNFKAEYSWFALSSTNPLTTISARSAARRIVRAVRMGEADVVLTPQAKLAGLAHGIFPGLAADILGVANRFLPRPIDSSSDRRVGRDINAPAVDSFLTSLGERAADQYQYQQKKAEKASVHPAILRGPAEAAG